MIARTPHRRVLAIGLDGFDLTLAERLMGEGMLPNLARLRARSARYELDHGRDRYSGLAWEHVSSGRAPTEGGRWSAVNFDPATYAVSQTSTTERPFLADIAARTVVFDMPYCDLSQAPNVLGVTSWGAHDPGVPAESRPAGLHEELRRRFGPYPASDWIYGFCWPSAEKARIAGEALARAVDVRALAARWLFCERLPEWDCAIVVVSEGHSAIEPLWHGVDASHPLHGLESAAPAAHGLREVYAAIDRLIGTLQDACPDATLMLFAMHGMGANDADVPAMALLPELLFREAFGKRYMKPVQTWVAGTLKDGIPLLGKNSNWEQMMLHMVPKKEGTEAISDESGVGWIPGARYARFWPRMRAFALPSYYDGRVRINVAGREGEGLVAPAEYRQVCEEVRALVRACRNAITGEEVVAEIYAPKDNPADVGPSEADLYVVWKSSPLGLSSPHGEIGPIPYRRTGGHTSGRGFLYMAGEDIAAGEGGRVSAFDVVPTIIDLLGEQKPAGVSGTPIPVSPLGSEERRARAAVAS